VQKINQNIALNQAALAKGNATSFAPAKNVPQPFRKVLEQIEDSSKMIKPASNHEEFDSEM